METIKIVVFKAGNEEYGIHVFNVITIEKMQEITPIPKLPEYVSGVVTIRDELIPVFDLSQILYNRSTAIDPFSTRLILLNIDQLHFALLVSEAKELLEINIDQIKNIDLINYKDTSYYSGIVHINERIITLIDPKQLIMSLRGIEDIHAYLEEARNLEKIEGAVQ